MADGAEIVAESRLFEKAFPWRNIELRCGRLVRFSGAPTIAYRTAEPESRLNNCRRLVEQHVEVACAAA